jgi:hypothetical protein
LVGNRRRPSVRPIFGYSHNNPIAIERQFRLGYLFGAEYAAHWGSAELLRLAGLACDLYRREQLKQDWNNGYAATLRGYRDAIVEAATAKIAEMPDSLVRHWRSQAQYWALEEFGAYTQSEWWPPQIELPSLD